MRISLISDRLSSLGLLFRGGKCDAASAKRAVISPGVIFFVKIRVVRECAIHWWQCSMLFVDGEVALSSVYWMVALGGYSVRYDEEQYWW